MLADALGSISKTFSNSEPKSTHEVFIETELIPSVQKVQKEIGWRRHKDCQTALQEAILALKAFQHEKWPVSNNNNNKAATTAAAPPVAVTTTNSTTTATVDAVTSPISNNNDNVTDDGETITLDTNESEDDSTKDTTKTDTEVITTATSADNDDTKPVVVEDSEVNNNNDNDNNSKEDTKPPASPSSTNSADLSISTGGKSITTSTSSSNIALFMHDDPLTRENVHTSIELTLKALMLVLINIKLPKVCEVTLDTITIIVSHRHYMSGRAGGIKYKNTILYQLLDSISKCSESQYEIVQHSLINTLTTIVTSPKCSVHEDSILTAMRSTFHVYLVTKSDTCKNEAKHALIDMLKAVLFRMEAHEAVLKATTTNNDTNDNNQQQQPQFASQYHADAYYLFRSLCKLSSKELPADNVDENSKHAKGYNIFNSIIPTDPTELHSKILSLELILIGIEYCGDAFMTNKFLYLIQHYLCVSLLKNCVSNHTHVAFLSQKIFLVLVYKFKGHLKEDIEVFMSNVFFRVLESQNSSFKQKALVLESLRSLCRDPVLLTQIFLNYDCDFDAMNLYKDIVHMLTKLGGKATAKQYNTTSSTGDIIQENELSLAAIECLVTILQAFLRALGLQYGEDSDTSIDSAGARIRGMLQLDSALAISHHHNDDKTTDGVESVISEEVSLPQSEADSAIIAERIVDAFDRKRNAEQNFEIGAVKFTLSLKTGLNFFIENGFVKRDAKEIALFFLSNKDKLDKTQMGEALGREPDAAFVKEKDVEADLGGSGFWVRILHHYVNALDFKDLMFDEAIRLFLSGFRLPGEAQKIDRIMEKFAERFTSQNPNVFPSSDTAFILAFSVIMLNTDLHNPSIKPERRMTVDAFLRNNRGIGENGGDLPEEFLRGIFDRIKQRPFSLKEDDAAREKVGAQKQIFDTTVFFEGSSLFGASSEERKRENFKKERDEMMAATEQLIRRRPAKNSKNNNNTEKDTSAFTSNIAPADVVKPMFDVTWGPLLGILSQVLECADDERSVAVCLNGFVYAIRLAANSRMSLARDTFVSSLAKFTFLGSLKEMKWKNVESIRTLLSVAVVDGEHLGESWAPVLQCISQLARLRLTASGLDTDESFLMVESPKRGGESRPDLKAREAEESNGRAVLEAVQEVLIDKVFSSTVNLSAKSLAHFVEQLIVVASSEISSSNRKGHPVPAAAAATTEGQQAEGSGPGKDTSIFLLQRLVDVADYNMDVRPRLVWAQVWELMADFFVNLACHDNQMVSVFAIDSVKQLSLKFLEKPELSEFNFQCSFLRPFQIVMEDQNSREDIRELVLQCVDTIIRTKSHHLRSGWKIFFSILNLAAKDSSEKIEYLGLNVLQRLLDEHLEDIGSLADKNVIDDGNMSSPIDIRNRNANAEDFVSLCRASLAFIQFEESESMRPLGLTMRAFSHTAIYADLLAAQRVLPPVSGAQCSDPDSHGYTYNGLSEQEGLAMVLWRPLLEGLAKGIRSTARTSPSGIGCLVQRGSVLALRAILLRHGHIFSSPQLACILKDTILPAIQFAAENEHSPIISITSETPFTTDIDFMVNSLPIPPDPDDPEFLKALSLSASLKRPVGQAELMLEASFIDLRHNGDGDLRKVHILAKKDSSNETEPAEQPFPDSWLATTAPIAIGLLTDLVTEFVVYRESEGRELIWPLIAGQYKLWCIGRRSSPVWSPCEALVRTTCRELHRLPSRVFDDGDFTVLSRTERMDWASIFIRMFSGLLTDSVAMEEATILSLLEAKEASLKNAVLEDDASDAGNFPTQYGQGRLIKRRKDVYRDGSVVSVNFIELDFGILFQPISEDPDQGIPEEVDIPDAYWVSTVPTLKVRCIMAHILQQALCAVLGKLIPLSSHSVVVGLLRSLERSRNISSSAVSNKDIAMAFQDSLLKDWGDGIRMPDEATEATKRLSLLHGSSIFFLSQEAGATKAYVDILSSLYLDDGQDNGWNRADFAEEPLIAIASDILDKFSSSYKNDGHLVDSNVWRNTTESGSKVALFCTSFASVVVDILKTIRSVEHAQFEKYKDELFPRICKLILVESEEIRDLVYDIMAIHVAPFVGVSAFPRNLAQSNNRL